MVGGNEGKGGSKVDEGEGREVEDVSDVINGPNCGKKEMICDLILENILIEEWVPQGNARLLWHPRRSLASPAIARPDHSQKCVGRQPCVSSSGCHQEPWSTA